jgi:hypothetical protein
MLHDLFASHLGDIGVLPSVATGAALPQEIPILVEPYGDLIEALAVLFGQLGYVAVLEQAMLFGNETLNVFVYLRIVHGRNLPRVSEALV